MKDSAVLLRMEGIVKSFPGVRALDGAQLEVKSGSVHALMGENGAGKSTLMKCLFGIYRPEGGKIFLDGEPISFQNAKDALLHGVAMVHQELNQAMRLSVMDNMFLGRTPRLIRGLPFTGDRRLYAMTKAALDEIGLDIDPRARVDTLSVSKRQMLEIAKAISYGARVIVFDEPTSSLGEDEVKRLFEIIEKLKARGCGIVYISHKMDEIFKICDRITVMRDGRHITTKDTSNITMDEIIRLMVGRTLEGRYPKKSHGIGDVILSVASLNSLTAGLSDISFELREGEILGIGGLDGSGRTELLESIFGLRRCEFEKMEIGGVSITSVTPRRAIEMGLALVTEERRKSGIFPVLSITDNTVISSLKKFNTGPILSKSKMKKATLENISSLRIKTPSEKQKIKNLSGGNQQKVIIGRWLLTEPRVMMLDEPTRGIDVGAKYEIYKLIIDFAKSGGGVLLVSSEMGELLGLCDRILVLSDGKAKGELLGSEATQEKIMTLASGEVL